MTYLNLHNKLCETKLKNKIAEFYDIQTESLKGLVKSNSILSFPSFVSHALRYHKNQAWLKFNSEDRIELTSVPTTITTIK